MTGGKMDDAITPTHNDVLYGRTNECRKNGGTIFQQQLVEERFEEHELADDRSDFVDQELRKRDKMVIKREIIALIKERGGRFLQRKPKTKEWEQLSDDIVITKLVGLFSTERMRRKKANSKPHVKSSEHEEERWKCLNCHTSNEERMAVCGGCGARRFHHDSVMIEDDEETTISGCVADKTDSQYAEGAYVRNGDSAKLKTRVGNDEIKARVDNDEIMSAANESAMSLSITSSEKWALMRSLGGDDNLTTISVSESMEALSLNSSLSKGLFLPSLSTITDGKTHTLWACSSCGYEHNRRDARKCEICGQSAADQSRGVFGGSEEGDDCASTLATSARLQRKKALELSNNEGRLKPANETSGNRAPPIENSVALTPRQQTALQHDGELTFTKIYATLSINPSDDGPKRILTRFPDTFDGVRDFLSFLDEDGEDPTLKYFNVDYIDSRRLRRFHLWYKKCYVPADPKPELNSKTWLAFVESLSAGRQAVAPSVKAPVAAKGHVSYKMPMGRLTMQSKRNSSAVSLGSQTNGGSRRIHRRSKKRMYMSNEGSAQGSLP